MEKKKIIIPNGPVLIVLVGPSGAGKSTFTKTHFEDREVVSSDDIRTWLTGDFARQDKNPEVFDEFHRRIEVRLRAGQRVVADATHLRDGDRKRTAEVGFMLDVPVFYVVINRSVVGKLQTGGWRTNVFIKGRTLIEAHEETFVANEKKILSGDSDKLVTVIDTRDENIEIKVAKALPRDPIKALRTLYDNDFDSIRVIADVHGNINGLNSIIDQAHQAGTYDTTFFLFLGDVTDYGPESWQVVDLVNSMVSNGNAIMVRGNHDKKMHRYIEQTLVKGGEFTGNVTYGMDISTNQLKAMMPKQAMRHQMNFMSLVEQSPDWIELGDWMFAHAAIDYKMFGNTLFRAHRGSKIETMAIYGETDGTTTEKGFPNRTYNWIDEMPDRKNAVLGHQILSVEAPVMRRTPTGGDVVFLDTGSSKAVDEIDGFLSYWDFDIMKKGGFHLVPHDTFGRE
jgi:protein phosphatase